MLINAIHLASLLVFIRAWIIRFFVRLIFVNQDLAPGYVKSNREGAFSGEGTVYPSESPEFIPTYHWASWCSIFNIPCSIIWIIVLLFFFYFSFGHCTVCPCSNDGFWLHIWYLRTFLINNSAMLSIKYYLALISIGTIERIVPFRPNSAAMPQSMTYQRQI
jgi:hypothetical protein